MREKIIAEIVAVISDDVTIDVVVPEQDVFGHYSTNVAFKLAKIYKKQPLVVAEDLVEKLRGSALFSYIEIRSPGFINFWINYKEFHNELEVILEKGKDYGGDDRGVGKKYQVEFVSANPTGPLTLANGRGGFLGDALANILKTQGFEVEKEYYVNDTGNQVLTLGKSILANCGIIPFEETFYKGEYVVEWAQAHKDFVLENKDDTVLIGQTAADYFLNLIKEVLNQKAKIHFDRYTSEQDDIHSCGFIEKVIKIFEAEKVIFEHEGAVWLKSTDFGDDKDRVLITNKKTPTYLLSDAGHYLETKERGFNGKILILGPDHYGYVARIQAVAKLIGLEDSQVIITQAVRVVKGGEEIKMSKRSGVFSTFGGLIDEVDMDVVRLFFLMISPDSHMDFDIDLAREQSNKNPVFYIQYALVRAKSILSKTKKISRYDPELISSEEDIRLLRKLAEYPEVLKDVSFSFAVHRLPQYAYELARVFHNFYEKERIDGVDEDLASARRALVEASHIVLSNILFILGCTIPDKM